MKLGLFVQGLALFGCGLVLLIRIVTNHDAYVPKYRRPQVPYWKILFAEGHHESNADRVAVYIGDISREARGITSDLEDSKLDTPYRPGGWTVRQLLIHIGDSHLNSYVRFKWALTEDRPVIKAYSQTGWADLCDSKEATTEEAVQFIVAIHKRWVRLLRGLDEAQWQRSFVHPETKKEISIGENLALYDWHSRHHLAHIENLRQREGW